MSEKNVAESIASKGLGEERVERAGTAKRSRKKKFHLWNLDILIVSATIIAIAYALYIIAFATVHTRIDITKSDKGEISLIVDYDRESDVNVPGKDLKPMAEQVYEIVKERYGDKLK